LARGKFFDQKNFEQLEKFSVFEKARPVKNRAGKFSNQIFKSTIEKLAGKKFCALKNSKHAIEKTVFEITALWKF
jgi:hypothetical protein